MQKMTKFTCRLPKGTRLLGLLSTESIKSNKVQSFQIYKERAVYIYIYLL